MSKIFVVDDETVIRESCKDFLEEDGHTVMTMPTGDQLIAMVPKEKPDLILLDLKMPGEKGLSLLKRIPLVDGKQIPVVIFSGHVTPAIECEAYEAGVVDVIRKNVDVKQLRYKVNRTLSLKDYLGGTKDKMKWLEKIGKKLLIVDDDENIREFLNMFFSEKGFKVFTAETGNQALKIVQDKNPTMVLLDVQMPGMDGILVLKHIKQDYPDITVVMATGVTDDQVIQEAIQLGAYDYVTKPFDVRYLEVVVLKRLMLASRR